MKSDFLNYLCSLLWYLDPHWGTLEERSIKKPAFVSNIYKDKQVGHGDTFFNDYILKKQAKPSLSKTYLAELINTGQNYNHTTWMNSGKWKTEFQDEFQSLITNLEKYCNFLEKKGEEMSRIRKSLNPARNPITDGT